MEYLSPSDTILIRISQMFMFNSDVVEKNVFFFLMTVCTDHKLIISKENTHIRISNVP